MSFKAALQSLLSKRSTWYFFVGGLSLIVFFGIYIQSTDIRPIPGVNDGYYGGWDQGSYLAEAQAIRNFELTHDLYIYPIGFPLLGAVFVDLIPHDPFLPVTALCFTLFSLILFRIFLSLGCSPLVGSLITIVSLTTHFFLIKTAFVVPWQNTPCYVIVAYGLMLMLESRSLRVFEWVLLGLLGGWLLITRELEFLLFAGVLLPKVVAEIRNDPKRSLILASLSGLFILTWYVGVIWVDHSVSDGVTRYSGMVERTGFGDFNLFHKCVLLFSSSSLTFVSGKTILDVFPLLLLGFLGLVGEAVRNKSFKWALCSISYFCFTLVYLLYDDLWPNMFHRFGNYRYFVPLFPLSLIGCFFIYQQFREGVKQRVFALAAILLGLLPLGFGLTLSASEERATDEAIPVRTHQMLRLRGEGIGLGNVKIAHNGRALSHYNDYKHLLRQPGEVVLLFHKEGRGGQLSFVEIPETLPQLKVETYRVVYSKRNFVANVSRVVKSQLSRWSIRSGHW